MLYQSRPIKTGGYEINMYLVLDKSFLQGSSKGEIYQLYLNYSLLMPEVLFLEILTKEKDISKCFKKFPPIGNPVYLVPNVGRLIRYEVINNQPCTPIENQFLKIDSYIFNPDLTKGQFNFTRVQEQGLEKWEHCTLKITQSFVEKSVTIDYWFPELREYVPGGPTQIVEDAMLKVARNKDLIITIYSQLRDEIYKTQNVLWPEPSEIDQNWILFRYLQVHLLAAIEYVRRYGNTVRHTVSKRLINDRLDIDYIIVGCLADGLATADKTMGKFYNLLCPEKKLIFKIFETPF